MKNINPIHNYIHPSLLVVFAIVFILNPQSGFSQDSLRTLPYDSSEIETRSADENYFQDITSEDVFDYRETAENPDSLWTRIQRWLFQTIFALLDNKWASFFIKLAFFVVFGLVLIALINQVLGGNIKSAFSSKQSTKELSLNVNEAFFKKYDLDKMLKTAISERRYPDAVRILYLQALQDLGRLDLVQLKADKTNHDYIQELGQHAAATPFSRLTFFYEYIEYGDFNIDKTGFENVQQVHQQFKDQLSK